MIKNEEFENFDRTMRKLIKVSHSEIKDKLEAEKEIKRRKKKEGKLPPKRDKSHLN
jgi:hypothetical protein